MAEDKKQDKEQEEFMKKIDYIVETLYDMDVQRYGYAVALRRRHEALGDMKKDYDAMFKED